FVRDGKSRTAMTIPWGDVFTAYISTGIPNIETYMVVPPKTVERMQWTRRMQFLLKLGFVQSFMKQRIERSTPGPSEQRRSDRVACGRIDGVGVERQMLTLGADAEFRVYFFPIGKLPHFGKFRVALRERLDAEQSVELGDEILRTPATMRGQAAVAKARQ